MAPKTKVKPKDLMLARAFKREAQKILGDNLVSVVLYGSRARGTAKADSDMDILLLTKRQLSHSDPEDWALSEVSGRFLTEKDMLITAIPYSVAEYEKWKEYSPVLHWIGKEGVEI